MNASDDLPMELPAKAGDFARSHPEIWRAYAELGGVCGRAGSLDAKQQRLIKIALALAAGSEGATHSHVRRALGEGHDPAAIKQIALLAMPMLGFANAMRMMTWVEDVTGKDASR